MHNQKNQSDPNDLNNQHPQDQQNEQIDPTNPTDQAGKKTSRQANVFLKYTSLGLQMVLTLAVAGGLGFWLDTLTGWKFPVFLLTLLLMAFAGIIYHLIKSTS